MWGNKDNAMGRFCLEKGVVFMKTALITGADGFIGRHLVRALLSEKAEVFAIVHPENNIYEHHKIPNLHVRCIDLNRAQDYARDFPSGIDAMFHFAWAGVRPELRDDLDVQMANINMAMGCMKMAASIGIKKVIFPGSTNEYLYCGKAIGRDALPSPSNAYGAVKVALRYLACDFAAKNGIEFIYAIITGIYAADRRDNNVIFYTIDKLLKKEKPSLTRLEQLWDYVYVDDVISALMAIGRSGKGGAVYAVGHGDNWALSNYIEIIHRKIDPLLPLGIGEVPYADNGRMPSSCVDLSDIERDTGFKPKVDFEEGIARVIDRMRSEQEGASDG